MRRFAAEVQALRQVRRLPLAVMSEEPAAVTEPVATDEGVADAGGRGIFGWWRSSHPTFAALTGFYAGLAYIILVPGVAGAILAAVVGQDRAEELFPWLGLTLVVPLALLLPRKTRRFAQFVWLGIISTFVVIVGVGALVLWLMIKHG